MSRFVVTGPLVVARNADGALLYVYRDAFLPEDIPAEECARLVEVGLVARVADPAPAVVPVKRPAASASKATWVEYAVGQGADKADADRLTRDELVARFAEETATP